MPVMICNAQITDALPIARIKQRVWPDEAVDRAQVERALRQPDHVTLLARNDRVVGFVDAFPTMGIHGLTRWEIDLLAVDPDFQGQQIGQRLIHAATEAGQQAGAAFARALAQVANAASQGALRRCAYATDGLVYQLMVSSEQVESIHTLPSEADLVTVRTLNYSGLWLEGALSARALSAGQSVRTQRGLDLVGALIPVERVDLLDAAGSLGYAPVERFQWWLKEL